VSIEAATKEADSMKILLRVEDKILSATLIDSKTTRDFVSLLPVTLMMNDLFRREKFAHLPRAISEEGKWTHTYEIGDVAYWSPRPDVAIFYRHDGQEIPAPGIIVIGRIDSGVETLNVAGSVKVTFGLNKQKIERRTEMKHAKEARATSGSVASSEGSQTISITRSGSQPSTKGPAEYFTGSVRIDPLFKANDPLCVSGGSVTFEAGARTSGHTHPFGQILVVTAGSGWVQQWTGPIEEIRQGDVVRIPPGLKHWHGATATTGMTHIALQEQLEGRVVDWMEKVSDEQYGTSHNDVTEN
jgi:quercetin dioxygenase-like cupin family protein